MAEEVNANALAPATPVVAAEPAVKEEPAVKPAESAPAAEETKADLTPDDTNDTGELSVEDLNKDDGKLSGAEKRKEQLAGEIQDLKQQAGIDLNTEIRDLVSARNALRSKVQQTNNQAYRLATENELLDQINPETGEYYNSTEAKVIAMQQQMQLQQYNEQVADAQLTIQSEAQRAVADFPMFDSASPEYNPELAAQVDRLLGESLVFDQRTGQLIGSNVSPYQLYKSHHDAYSAAAIANQIKGQKATEAMLATADNVGGAPQKETPFDRLSTNEMRERLRAKGHDV